MFTLILSCCAKQGIIPKPKPVPPSPDTKVSTHESSQSYDINMDQIKAHLSGLILCIQPHTKKIGISFDNITTYVSITSKDFRIKDADFSKIGDMSNQFLIDSLAIEPIIISVDNRLWAEFGSKLPYEYKFKDGNIAKGKKFVLFFTLSIKIERISGGQSVLKCDGKTTKAHLLSLHGNYFSRIEEYNCPPSFDKIPREPGHRLNLIKVKVSNLEKQKVKIWEIDWDQEGVMERIQYELRRTNSAILKLYCPSENMIREFKRIEKGASDPYNQGYGIPLEEFTEEDMTVYIFELPR